MYIHERPLNTLDHAGTQQQGEQWARKTTLPELQVNSNDTLHYDATRTMRMHKRIVRPLPRRYRCWSRRPWGHAVTSRTTQWQRPALDRWRLTLCCSPLDRCRRRGFHLHQATLVIDLMINAVCFSSVHLPFCIENLTRKQLLNAPAWHWKHTTVSCLLHNKHQLRS